MADGPRYRPIGDYGFLSDGHSTALVSREGSIDWACFGRFDRGSTFGRLLDADRGGFYSIVPTEPVTDLTRRYLPGTLVLETTIQTASGTVVLTDAIAIRAEGAGHPGALIRSVQVRDGRAEIAVRIEPRFDCGSATPWLRAHDGGRFSAVAGDDAIVLQASVELAVDHESGAIVGEHVLEDGERLHVVLVPQAAHLLDPAAANHSSVADQLNETISWWERWSASTEAGGPHEDVVARSATVLKGLNCAPTGAIVAAATTSLPETVGGSANWDYRYCWVRDSTMTLDALASVGHPEVAQGLRDFLLRSSAGHGSEVQVAYGPYGERSLPERELDLEGWRGSAPVRVGNGAARQLQLDVYGHLLDVAHLWQTRDGDIDPDEWRFLASVVEAAIAHRHDPDAGNWEMRGPPQHFVHSKVMVWTAIDRGISLVEDHQLGGVDLASWQSARDDLRHEIETRGVDPDRGNFVQHYGTTAVDAALLKLPIVGFVEADDERMVRTTEAIMEELGHGPDFILRYRDQSGGSDEGVFLLCTAWLVEVLTMQGRLDEAERRFEALLGTGNDLGLFSEEWSVESQELLGNYPQAFTHLGIIAAARRLAEAQGD